MIVFLRGRFSRLGSRAAVRPAPERPAVRQLDSDCVVLSQVETVLPTRNFDFDRKNQGQMLKKYSGIATRYLRFIVQRNTILIGRLAMKRIRPARTRYRIM